MEYLFNDTLPGEQRAGFWNRHEMYGIRVIPSQHKEARTQEQYFSAGPVLGSSTKSLHKEARTQEQYFSAEAWVKCLVMPLSDKGIN